MPLPHSLKLMFKSVFGGLFTFTAASLYEFGGNGSDGFELEELVSEGYELLEVLPFSIA